MKNASINNKPGFEISILKAFLMKCNYEDYVNAYPSLYRQQFSHSFDTISDLSNYTPSTLSLNIQHFIEHSDINYALSTPRWTYPCADQPLPSLTYASIKLSSEIKMDPLLFSCLQSFYSHHSSLYNIDASQICNKIRPFYQISLLGDTYGCQEGGQFFLFFFIDIHICSNCFLISYIVSGRGTLIKGLSYGSDSDNAPVYRFGKVLYFFQHKLDKSNDDTSVERHPCTFAFCSWLVEETDLGYNGSAELLDMKIIKNKYSRLDKFSILPVHCIYSPLIAAPYVGHNGSEIDRFVYTAAVKKITI